MFSERELVHNITTAPQVAAKPGIDGSSGILETESQCSRKWLRVRVGGVYLASILASGVIFVWPVVQPYFEEAGVYADACPEIKAGNESAGNATAHSTCQSQEMMLSQAYLIGGNLLLVAAWPIGVSFDILGAKLTSALGCALCSVGGVALAVAVKHPSSASYLLLPGVLLCDSGSTMNSFALYGFLWHFHDSQGFLAGLANSTYAVSSILPLMLVKLLPFEIALWWAAALSAVALVLCVLMVPSSEEYLAAAEQVLGHKFEKPRFDLRSVVRSCYCIFEANATDNTLFTISLLFIMASGQYYVAIQWPFLKDLLGSGSAASQVALTGGTVYGVLGFFLSPMVGYTSDLIGMKGLVLIMTLLTTLMTPLIFTPSLTLQMAGNVVATVLSLLQGTYYYRWFALYAPPDMFGNFQGLICCFCGLFSLAITSLLQAFASSALSGLAAYIVPLAGLSAVNLFSVLAFCGHILSIQMPVCPPSGHDVHGKYEIVACSEGI